MLASRDAELAAAMKIDPYLDSLWGEKEVNVERSRMEIEDVISHAYRADCNCEMIARKMMRMEDIMTNEHRTLDYDCTQFEIHNMYAEDVRSFMHEREIACEELETIFLQEEDWWWEEFDMAQKDADVQLDPMYVVPSAAASSSQDQPISDLHS